MQQPLVVLTSDHDFLSCFQKAASLHRTNEPSSLKCTGSSASQQIPAGYGHGTFSVVFTNTQSLLPMLSHFNPRHAFPPYLRSILILSSQYADALQVVSFLQFSYRKLQCTSLRPQTCGLPNNVTHFPGGPRQQA